MCYKHLFDYLDIVRRTSKRDIYGTVNATLICNPDVSDFPEYFLFNRCSDENRIFIFLFSVTKFYARSAMYFVSFVSAFFYHKFVFKNRGYRPSGNEIIFDLFVDIEKVCKVNRFEDHYFSTAYPVLDNLNARYVFLPRLCKFSLNPLKAHRQYKKFFKIMSCDKNNFIFEYDLLSLYDFFRVAGMVLCYPFKTLKLLSKGSSRADMIFNEHLLKDIPNVGVDAFSRYVLGRNLASLDNISNVYSWSEGQDIERAFNFGVRETGGVLVNACQLLVFKVSTWFHDFQKVDVINNCAPHRVIVNGKNNLREVENIPYQLGVSFRYEYIFKQPLVTRDKAKNALVLGSYSVLATQRALTSASFLEKYWFKPHHSHHAVEFDSQLADRAVVKSENLSSLLSEVEILICGGGTGAAAEAVACGVSVIIAANHNDLVDDRLVACGRGQIWDLAFNSKELQERYAQLLNFRKQNFNKVKTIANWYRDNLFVEPSEKNISRFFAESDSDHVDLNYVAHI